MEQINKPKISFVTVYNDFSVGVNVLSSLLIEAGYEVQVIFFKLPAKAQQDWFSLKNTEFMEAVDSYGNIMSGNPTVNPPTDNEINLLISEIRSFAPEVVCFNSRSLDNELTAKVWPIVSSEVDALTIAGGFGPTLDPELYADLVDYVFVGEAEGCFLDLINKIVAGESIKEYPSICYKNENGEYVKNHLFPPGDAFFKKQVISKNTIYIEGDKVYSYQNRGQIISGNSYSTFVGKGCIMTCSYCSIGNWTDVYKDEGYKVPKRRNRKFEDVIDELVELNKRDVTFVHFRDEYLAAKPKDLIRFFNMYEEKVSIPFWCYLVPAQVLNNPEILEAAVNAGMVDTEVGFQSGSDRINREVFNRNLPNSRSLEYAKLLNKYNLSAKFDFIIFNPAVDNEDLRSTFDLIQNLPKERNYIFMPRLFYFKNVPIADLLEPYGGYPKDFEKEYRIALLYLICWVTTKEEFNAVLGNESMCSSYQELKSYYDNYVRDNNIKYHVGTHEIPDSITSHRYERIINNNKFDEVIVWSDQDYYNQMSHIFKGVKVKYHIQDLPITSSNDYAKPDVLSHEQDSIPLFICSARKQEIKMDIINNFPEYAGKIYV